MADDIRDNAARHRFELDLGGHIAFLTYRAMPGGLVLLHTEVPMELRRQGIGGRLVQGVLAALRARGDKVQVMCDFVQDFIRHHPEFADLVV